jgi:putative transposase
MGPIRTTEKILAEIGNRVGSTALVDVAKINTILRCFRKVVAKRLYGSKTRRYASSPKISHELEQLIVRMARETSDWGHHRIVDALTNLWHTSNQTIGKVLRHQDVRAAPRKKRTTTRVALIRSHLALVADTDFVSVEVLTVSGLVTYYVQNLSTT